jgi:hypothetical protein
MKGATSLSVGSVIVGLVHATARSRHSDGPSALEPHTPLDRLEDGTWLYAPLGEVLVVAGGERVVCHACGDSMTAVSRQHVARHGLDLDAYRERFGLNRKQTMVAPVLAQVRREEGRRRWESNEGVRDGLAVGQAMARSGELHDIGAAAQPAGSRRRQGRRPASRDAAAPALGAVRAAQAAEARHRWEEQAHAHGFAGLEVYLAVRRASGPTAWQIRRELGCGSPMADRLLKEGR